MDLIDTSRWKRSKVESFIRRHLNRYQLGITRYYEMCMWDNKGTFIPRYAILMDSTLVVTENPPKTVLYTIPLSKIHDISLIADRHSFIKARTNKAYICQHVSIIFESKNKKKKDETESEDPSKSLSTIDDLSRASSPATIGTDGEIYSNVSTILNSRVSEVSISPSPSSIDHSYISHTILTAYEPTIKGTGSTRHGKATRERNISMSTSAENSDNGYGTGSSSINPALKEWLEHSHRHTPAASKYGIESDRFTTGSLSSQSLESMPPLISHSWASSSSSAVEKEGDSRPNTWPWALHPNYDMKLKGQKSGRGGDTPKSPDIKDVLDARNRRIRNRKLRMERDREIQLQQLHSGTPSDTTSLTDQGGSGSGEGDNKKLKGKPLIKPQDKTEVLNLYFYQPDSEFLSELFLLWDRQRLKNTESQEKESGSYPKTLTVNKSIRAAERVLNLVAQDFIYYEEELQSSVSFPQKRLSMELGYTTFLQRVGFLHKCLMRYEHLKYLCWKNSVIISGLVRAMTMSVEPMKSNLIGDPLEIKQAFMDRVAVYAVVMDIFRSLYEACGVTWFKRRSDTADKEFEEEGSVWQVNSSWNSKLTIFDITRKLLSSVLLCPYLPKTCEIPEVSRCFFHITDPRKFVSARWLNHRDENEHKIIKLLCTAHNASVALLFELLAVLHFLPSELERNVVAKGIKNIDLERFIRLSVTQIINLLWSSRDTMSAPEAMLLYRQLWILTSLSKQDPIVLEFIRANFAEEFRYYVHPKGIKTRIPDQYTIKQRIIDLCEELRANVEGKRKLKA